MQREFNTENAEDVLNSGAKAKPLSLVQSALLCFLFFFQYITVAGSDVLISLYYWYDPMAIALAIRRVI